MKETSSTIEGKQPVANGEPSDKEHPPPKSRMKRLHFGHTRLPSWEKFTYWSIWLLVNVYLFHEAYKLSQRLKPQLSAYDFNKGWLAPWKDVSDFEWTFWRRYSSMLLWLYTAHTVIFTVVKATVPDSWWEEPIMGVVSVILVSLVLTPTGIALVLLHTVAFYVVVKTTVVLSRGSKFFMWAWWIFMIAFVVNRPILRKKIYTLVSLDPNHWNIVLFSTMLCYLRFISYGCYISELISNSKYNSENNKVISQNNKSNNKDTEEANATPSFASFLFYVLYVPFFNNGPVATYDTFVSDRLRRSSTTSKFAEAAKDFVTCVLHSVALEIFLHFVYANAITQEVEILRTLTPLESCVVVWMHLNIFCVKYYIFYRFSGIFAKLDGIVPPGPPKCIASLYTFVDMWRYFDKGLYRLLQQCIYFPLGGSKHGVLRQTLASFLCFGFVGFWHGNTQMYIYWAITNWLGIVAETVTAYARHTTVFEAFRRKHIGAVAFRRLCALCGSFSVLALVYTNMVFLVDVEAANVLLERLFAVWYAPLLTLLVYYIANNCSIDVN